MRIIIEKLFGRDMETAKELNTLLEDIFEEKQIYRIDHYLGKETVQNIMTFRFANAVMEPLWNRNHIEHVQIAVSEQLGYINQAPEAYETLILDTMQGDQTLFMRADQVEAGWEVMMPILNAWQEKISLSFPNYAANSLGPKLAEALVARDGFNWFTQPVKE